MTTQKRKGSEKERERVREKGDGKETEELRVRSSGSAGKRNTCAPLNSPKVRFQAVAYYTVPFHLTQSLAGRCERRGSL